MKMDPAELKLAMESIAMLTKMVYFVGSLAATIAVWATRMWMTQRQQTRDIIQLQAELKTALAQLNDYKIHAAVNDQINKRMGEDIAEIKNSLKTLTAKYG